MQKHLTDEGHTGWLGSKRWIKTDVLIFTLINPVLDRMVYVKVHLAGILRA